MSVSLKKITFFNNTESCKVQLHLKILISIFCLVNLKIWNKPNTTSQIISQSQMGQMELTVIHPSFLTLVSILSFYVTTSILILYVGITRYRS